jgi:3',5'-cyclic AMP phosphodiesterase CpdA
LVVLDSISPVERQTAWLEEVLSQSNATWKFVMFHFPPYNPETTEVEYPDVIAQWVPLFDRYQVDVVLNGHIHRYVRSYPMKAGQRVEALARGTVYLDSVAVPNPPARQPAPAWAATFQGGQPLFQTFQIHGRRCELQTYNLEGTLVDTAILEK